MKKPALNPYWSKIGLALVNWLFLVSPNVRITNLLPVLLLASILKRPLTIPLLLGLLRSIIEIFWWLFSPFIGFTASGMEVAWPVFSLLLVNDQIWIGEKPVNKEQINRNEIVKTTGLESNLLISLVKFWSTFKRNTMKNCFHSLLIFLVSIHSYYEAIMDTCAGAIDLL